MRYIQDAIDLAKKLMAVSDSIRNADMKLLVAELTSTLADLKLEIASHKEEIASLRGQLADHQKKAGFRSKIEHRDGVYYFTEPTEGRSLGPYCTNCFDSDEKLILLTETPEMFNDFGKYNCNRCNGHFVDPKI